MTDSSKSKSHSVSFSLRAGEMREVRDDGVEAYDEALAAVGRGEVMHFIDPRRIQRFEAGGPPVWSVASVPVGDDVLCLTYGFARAIDQERGVDFEMSVRVPGKAGMWPALFLRALCRYMLSSGRPLEVSTP